MNTDTDKNIQWFSRSLLLLLVSSALLLSACGKSDSDGDVVNEVELPTDDTEPFTLYCPNVGLFREDCVLEDPNNPYRNSAVTEDNKFDLDADAPSATAKFYVWATALARGAGAPGENQFFVALNLHFMWASSNSEATRVQALRAYQSYLDNYFDSITFFEIPEDSENFVPQSLNEFTGEMLFDPADVTNTYTSAQLFKPDPDLNREDAAQEIANWGYFFDQDIEVFTRTF